MYQNGTHTHNIDIHTDDVDHDAQVIVQTLAFCHGSLNFFRDSDKLSLPCNFFEQNRLG